MSECARIKIGAGVCMCLIFISPLRSLSSCLVLCFIPLVQYLQADAEGSPAFAARGFTAASTSGSKETEATVSGNKVSLAEVCFLAML